MTSEKNGVDQQLNQLASKQGKILAAVKTLEERMEVMREELQRAYAALNRAGLAQESSKNSLQRQEKTLLDLKSQMSDIMEALQRLK